jgi:hypothetical protein
MRLPTSVLLGKNDCLSNIIGISQSLVAAQYCSAKIVMHRWCRYSFQRQDERRTMKLTLKKMAFVLSLGLGLGLGFSATASADGMCSLWALKCSEGNQYSCQLYDINNCYMSEPTEPQ